MLFPLVSVAACLFAIASAGAAADESVKQRELAAELRSDVTSQVTGNEPLRGRFHTVISPLFNHVRGQVSYIRLKNNQRVAVEHAVTVVGIPTGRVFGTVKVTIPGRASPQFAYGYFLERVGIGPPTGTEEETAYALYLSAALEGQLYQHVIFNPDRVTMQNMSVCVWDKHADNRGVGTSINNVHTTTQRMASFPSIVGLHHYGAAPARYTARIHRSADGTNLANFSFTLRPNESFEANANWWQYTWTPAEGETYFNIEFSREDGGPFEAIPQHIVHDVRLETYVNMTQYCPIRRAEPERIPETERMPETVPVMPPAPLPEKNPSNPGS